MIKSVFSLFLFFSLVPVSTFIDQNVENDVIGQSIDEYGQISYIHKNDTLNQNGLVSNTPFYSPNSEDYISSTLIFGDDDRKKLSEDDYTKFPFRTVCLVYAYYDFDDNGTTDQISIGTGVLVGPSTILTAEHIIYDNSRSKWSYTIEVMPGGHKDSNNNLIKPYGSFWSRAASIGVNYDTNNSADDWAIVDINSEIGNEIGYMGVSSSLNNGDLVRLYGYHGDYDSRLGYGSGYVSGLETYRFKHNCDAISGSSGGPITLGSTTVVGIHSGGCDENWDYACKISNYIVGWVNERINK